MTENEPLVQNRRKTCLKLNTMRFVSEPRSIKIDNESLIGAPVNERHTKGDEHDFNDTLKPAISAFIDYNVAHGSTDLRKKIDYFITPYNQGLDWTQSMIFNDKTTNWKNLKDVARKDWKIISNFILKSTRRDFRGKLSSINTDLYDNLKDLAWNIIGLKSPNALPKNSESNRNSNILKFRGVRKLWSGKKSHIKKGLQESFAIFQKISSKELPLFLNDRALNRSSSNSKVGWNFSEMSQLKPLQPWIKRLPSHIEEGASVISPLVKNIYHKIFIVERINNFILVFLNIEKCILSTTNEYALNSSNY